MALALAVHHTGRREILAFKGGYHGGVLAFGSGEPSPVTVPHAFVLGDYDAVEETRALIRAARARRRSSSSRCSAPAAASRPRASSCAMLREEATATGAVLIFDEVMTSRLGPSGVVPDLMTVGKYLAGGMSFGAFGGRRELMSAYDPTPPGALFHAGTFNNNVLSMSAGIAGLTHVLTDEALAELNARGDRLREDAQPRGRGARRAAARLRARLADDDPPGPRAFNAAEPPDAGRELVKRLLFFELLDAGQWIAARGMIALSLPITDEDCAAFVAAFDAILARHADAVAPAC